MSFDDVEKARIKYKNKLIMVILISLVVIVTLAISTNVFVDGESVLFLFFLSIALFAMDALIVSGDKKRYTLAFKTFFVKSSLEKVFTDLKYMPESGISPNVIRDTGMMYMGDRYSSEDFVSGKYKNIGFCQADVHIEEEHQSTDSEGHTTTYYVTIFRGRWMIFDFNKTFKANVQVCQKGFGNNKVINSIFSKSTRYQKIQMESTDFNKRFLVYAQDAHDAFYIITPHIMEKIIKLSGDINGKILLCFINNQLHVGLYDNDDSFEPSSCFSTIDTERVTQDVLSDINKITMFVDELELDNDLFKSKNVN